MMEKLLIFHGSRTLHTYDPETEDEVDNFDDKNDLELAQAAEADLHEPEGEWNKVFKATRRVREEADMISELLDCSAAYERQEAESKCCMQKPQGALTFPQKKWPRLLLDSKHR
jgi:hypothetical protein